MTDLVINGQTIYIDGSPVAVPDSFTSQAFQNQINTAASFGSYGDIFLFIDFIWGGQGDLQRPDGATGQFVGTYTAAAAYLYGAAAAVSGLTLNQALQAAGDLNYFSTSSNTGGAYGLSPARVDQITQAYTDYSNGVFAADDSTSSLTEATIVGEDLDNLPSVPSALIDTAASAPTADVYRSITNVIHLMQSAINAAVESGSSTLEGYVASLDADANQFAMEHGYYVTQPGDVGSTALDTANNIVADITAATGESVVDGAELLRLNGGPFWAGGNFSAGGLVYLAIGSAPSGATEWYYTPILNSIVYDPNVDSAQKGMFYEVGNLLPQDPLAAAGEIEVLDNAGDVALMLQGGEWSDAYQTSQTVDGVSEPYSLSVVLSNGSGTYTVNDATGVVTFTSTNPDIPPTSFSPPGSNTPPPVVTGGPGGPTGGPPGDDPDPIIYPPGAPPIDPANPDGPTPTSPFPDGGPTSDGPDAGTLAGDFSASQNTDPIVLDLSGDNAGVQLTSLANSSAYFDLYDTGFAVHTGWVGPTTGILVNTTDPTNITDLFGNSSTSGFAALQALDVNGTGVLNSSDPGWSNLYVWVDANGNGVVDPGEVESLSDLGITSISLNTSVEDETVNGNYIGDVATFTYTDGSTGQVAEAYFNNTAMDSTYTGSYTLNPETLMLPDLRGYGTLPDLYIAESLDPALFNDVASLAGDSIADAATFGQQVTNILYEWAGVEGVDPTSRGGYVDAQDLETLEAVVGESYVSFNGVDGDTNPPDSPLGAGLESAFNILFTAEEERLLAQGPLAQYLSGVTYDYDTDSMTGTTDFSALVTAVGDNIPSDPTAVQYLATLGQFMDQLASDLGVSDSTFDSALADDFANVGSPMSSASVDNLHYLTPSFDGSGDATFSLDSGGAIADGETGYTNILDVGNDMSDLTQTVINNIQTLDLEGTDVVTLTAAELSSLDNVISSGATIYASTAGTYDLSSLNETGSFTLSAVNSSANVTLIGDGEDGQYLYGGSGADTLEAGNGAGAVLVAGSGNTTLIAGNGGDTLYDGSGVDTLIGGTGSDTFCLTYATSGTTVTGNSDSDTLIAGADDISGVSISGVQTLETSGDFLELTASQLSGFSNLVGFTAWYLSTSLYAADGGTYDLADVTATGNFNLDASGTTDAVTLIGNDQDGQTLTAGSGNDTLTAGNGAGDVLQAGSGTDTLTAGSGGDTLYDGSGVDTLIGGTGSDTFYLTFATSGTTVTGNSDSDTLIANTDNISGVSISGVQTLETSGDDLELTAGQLSGFSNLVGSTTWYMPTSLYAADGGTYDLADATATGYFNLDASGTTDDVTLIGNDQDGQTLTAGSGNDTLTAGNGAGDVLQAGSGNDTLTAGNGGDTLYDGSGVDTLIGGTGSDTFCLTYATSGTTVTGNSDSDTLIAGADDISGVSISGVQTLQDSGESLELTAGQLSGFSNLVGSTTWYMPTSLYAADGGTYDLADVTATGYFNLNASGTSDDVTLIGNDQDGQTLTAGSGNDTLTAGDGAGDILIAGSGTDTLTAGNGGDTLYDGSGVDTLIGGTGSDTFYLTYATSGTTVTGNSDSDTLIAGSDISGVSISRVQTLETSGYYLTLNASQLSNFSNLENGYYVEGYTGATDTLYAADSGTYDLASTAVTGLFDLSAANTSDDVTLIGNDQDGQTLTAGSGNDTLTAGNGAGDVLQAGSGNDTLTAGSGDDTFYGSGGTNTYQFNSGFGQDTIYDAGANGAAAGTVAFGSGITDENLWFQQSGNDLVIDLLGTSSQIDISGFYNSAGNQVASFTADGLQLDSQLASLVSAMASFAADNPGFNPATATGMPTDTTLQNAIAAAWHT